MADLSQIVRWNANFVRGLAQSVLDRAKTIRSSLKPASADVHMVKKAASKKAKLKKTAVKTARKPKRNNA